MLIVKPTFSKGNLGDSALIKIIKHLYKDKSFIPDSKAELNSQNAKKL